MVEYLEFLNFPTITQSAADTFGQEEMPTPVGRANNLAMALHQFEIGIPTQDAGAHGDNYLFQYTKASKAAIVAPNDPDVLLANGLKINFVTSGMQYYKYVRRFIQPKPILYAKSKMWLGVNTAGQGAAQSFYGRVGYTIRNVKLATMLEALVD